MKKIILILTLSQTPINTLFAYYIFTGGMPKYIAILLTHKLFDEQAIINFILSSGSPLLDEGFHVLIEGIGKEYRIYFSILELIAVGKNSRSEIESILQKNIGGYLEKLEQTYRVVRKYNPINAQPNSKLQKYQFRDQFLRFWFRFIYRNISAVEMLNLEYIQQILSRDFSTYKGKILEDFYYDLFSETKKYNKLGCYWEKNGSNEIDLVAMNDLNKELVIAEIKLDKNKLRLQGLKYKAEKLIKDYANYSVEYLLLSLDNANQYLNSTKS